MLVALGVLEAALRSARGRKSRLARSADFSGNANCTASLCSHGSHVAGILRGAIRGGWRDWLQRHRARRPHRRLSGVHVFTADRTGCMPGARPARRLRLRPDQRARLYQQDAATDYSVSSANMSLGGGIPSRQPATAMVARQRSTICGPTVSLRDCCRKRWMDERPRHARCFSTAVTVGAVNDTDLPVPPSSPRTT